MDTKIRLTRKPLTTALWTILVAAMALLLSVGAAMMYSSGSLAGILDKYHTSIAVRTDRAVYENETEDGVWRSYEKKWFDQSHIDQLEAMDSVEKVYFHTLTGGYCPQLSPRISTGYPYDIDESYDNAVVIGTISRMTEPEDLGEVYDVSRIGGNGSAQCYGVRIEFQVEQLVAGNEDYTRWNSQWFDGYINMGIEGPIAEDLELLQVGQRYILSGQFDRHQFVLHENLDDSGHAWLHSNGLSFFVGDTGYSLNSYRYQETDDGTFRITDGMISGPEIEPIDGTLEEFLARPENAPWVELLKNESIAQHCFPVIGTDALETMYIFVNQNAGIVDGRFFIQEEYEEGQRVCILNETTALDAGIGVGDTITLSQYLCHNIFHTEWNRSTSYSDIEGKLNNPTVGEYQPDTVFGTENEEFTVVGLYRLRNEWSDGSYDITPNTIFIPQKAQIEGAFGGLYSETEVERRKLDGTTETYTSHNEGASYGIYMSLKLKNGKVEEFENEIEGSNLAGQFLTLDQGFGKIQSTLNEISGSAEKLFWLVAAGWLLLLALYALLYQGYQRQNLGIMRSLGASPKLAGRYLFGSGMTVAGIGIAVGTLLAGSVLGAVQAELFRHSFGMEISKYSNAVLSDDAIHEMVAGSQLPLWVILAIGAGQLAVFALVLKLQANRMSRRAPRELLSK